MYSAIFSLRLLCAIYIGSVVWFNVRQAKIPLFTQKRNRRPGDKTIRTTFPTKGKQTGQIRRRTCLDTKPTKQSKRSSRPDKTYRTSQAKIPSRPTKTPLRFRSDETVRTTGSNRSNGPDRLNDAPLRLTKAQVPVGRNDTAHPPRPDTYLFTSRRKNRPAHPFPA